MIDVRDWVKKHVASPAAPKAEAAEPAAAGTELPDLRDADPAIALNELTSWLEPAARDAPGTDAKTNASTLAQVQDAGTPHVAALLGQYFTSATENQAARGSTWKSLIQYQARLTHALGRCAKSLLAASYEDAALLGEAEACTARALHSCRVLAKICLVNYAGVPNGLWRTAYALHAAAEEIGSAASPVKAVVDPKKVTSVEQEFLRLLMLQVSAPDMMAPEQIECADRALEQVGEGLTLRPPGVSDNPFCFEPQGDAPPRRVSGPEEAPAESARYFGPGMGLDALERIQRQLASAKLGDIKVFGVDLPPQVQLGAVQHLVAFWQSKAPDAAPARAPASGKLQLVHRYAAIWKQLNDAQHGAGELSLADTDDVAPQPPETWTLREATDNELGTTFSQALGGWAKCGVLVGVTPENPHECWVGVIRRMHRAPGDDAHADIAILSRAPRTLSLREVREKGEDSAVSEAASRQFAFGSVRAVILADGAEGPAARQLLLPTDGWKAGRVYETTDEPSRYLRAVQATRYGEDYVRATFEWLPGPR